MERLLAERLIAHYAPSHERYNSLLALPHEADNILDDVAARLLPIVTETMREVKEKVGLAQNYGRISTGPPFCRDTCPAQRPCR
jgi:hypothetical protein